MDEHRSQRISEALREELSELIGYEMSDPRVETVDVIDVQVSPDLRIARVMVVIEGGEEEQRVATDALQGARQFLRRQLAVRLKLHRTPDLQFEVEGSFGSPERMRSLLKRVRRGRPKDSENLGNQQEK
jgi:ribosome-binding factor A